MVNFAPYACVEVVQKPDLETEMCGRPNRSGAINGALRGSQGSSVIIDSSVFSSARPGADIILEEVPSMLILRDNWNNNAAPDGLHQDCRSATATDPCYKLVHVAAEIDLDGPYMDIANQRGKRARPLFKIETMWTAPSVTRSTHSYRTERK